MSYLGKTCLFCVASLLISLPCFADSHIMSGLAISDYTNECSYLYAGHFANACAIPLELYLEQLKKMSLNQIMNLNQPPLLEFDYAVDTKTDIQRDVMAWMNDHKNQPGLGITEKARQLLSEFSITDECRFVRLQSDTTSRTYYRVQCSLK